jgi:hypothetical protein
MAAKGPVPYLGGFDHLDEFQAEHVPDNTRSLLGSCLSGVSETPTLPIQAPAESVDAPATYEPVCPYYWGSLCGLPKFRLVETFSE